jgi:ubiquinone/menaquinone biosynthesis C-methylase UbiE
MEDDILNEQIAYYRARAPKYEESLRFAGEPGFVAGVQQLLHQMGPCEQILEIASGTGLWTKDLLSIGRAVTCIDASPEMIEIARRKYESAPVQFQLADIFQWEPGQQYDLVFIAFWLSHVPPDRLGAFLEKVSRATRPGGYVVIIDEYAPMPEDLAIMKEGKGGAIYSQRTLREGQNFTIVKVFYDTDTLLEMFGSLGFESDVHKLDEFFFFFWGKKVGIEGHLS